MKSPHVHDHHTCKPDTSSPALQPTQHAGIPSCGGYHGLTLLAMLFVVTIPGCATLSQGQCETGDWQAIGRQDGDRGLPRSQLFKHQEACVEYGMRPDAAAYDTGREQGLRNYCTPRRGYFEGRSGRRYYHVCAAPFERDFLIPYQHGKQIHEAQQTLDAIERKITSKQRQIDDKDTTDIQRQTLHKELAQRRQDQRRAQHELLRLEQRYPPPIERYRR